MEAKAPAQRGRSPIGDGLPRLLDRRCKRRQGVRPFLPTPCRPLRTRGAEHDEQHLRVSLRTHRCCCGCNSSLCPPFHRKPTNRFSLLPPVGAGSATTGWSLRTQIIAHTAGGAKQLACPLVAGLAQSGGMGRFRGIRAENGHFTRDLEHPGGRPDADCSCRVAHKSANKKAPSKAIRTGKLGEEWSDQ